jgi:hypothetical protein
MMVFSPMMSEFAAQRQAPLIPTPSPIRIRAPGAITIKDVLARPMTGLDATRVLILTPSLISKVPPRTQRIRGRPLRFTDE